MRLLWGDGINGVLTAAIISCDMSQAESEVFQEESNRQDDQLQYARQLWCPDEGDKVAIDEIGWEYELRSHGHAGLNKEELTPKMLS